MDNGCVWLMAKNKMGRNSTLLGHSLVLLVSNCEKICPSGRHIDVPPLLPPPSIFYFAYTHSGFDNFRATLRWKPHPNSHTKVHY